MIEKMKKFTFLVTDREYDAFIDSLRQLGVVHVQQLQQGASSAELQQVMELEARTRRELIDSYDSLKVTASEDDPTVCLVEFGFTVTHGLTRIYLTAHITV